MVLHRPGVHPGGHHRLDQVGQLTQLVCLELSQSAVLFILKVKNILKYTSTHGEVTLSGKVKWPFSGFHEDR